MDSATYEALAPDVLTAAKTAAREWGGLIDVDDSEQEIWARLLDAGANVYNEIAALEKPARISYLTEVAHQIGMKYRDDYELFSGNHTYGTRQVREMLDDDALASCSSDFDDDTPLWELPEEIIGQLRRTDKETATERIDLMMGMKSLQRRNASYAFSIVEKYVNGVDPEDGTARKNLTRAVDALTREMNNVHRRRIAEYDSGPGTRKVVGNYDAIRQTDRSYHGGNKRVSL